MSQAPCRSRLRVRRPRFLRAGYLRNAASFLVFTALYAAVNIVLFSWRVWQYRDRALLEQMARGTGEDRETPARADGTGHR